MGYNILFAAALTAVIYLIIETGKSIRQFFIFRKLRETILTETFSYLEHTPKNLVDLSKLQGRIAEAIGSLKLSSWVKEIKISWQSVDVIQFVFELKFEKLRPHYKFLIGLKELEDFIHRA